MNTGHGNSKSLRWHYEDLPFDQIQAAELEKQELLFYMVTTASFVEITTDLYTRNLITYFSGDQEVQSWLGEGWEPEEMQHGEALRQYSKVAWPQFDWETVYHRFLDDYSTYCQIEQLGPTRALEMARRCIVETGTCSYYSMLAHMSPCPVLRQLTEKIRADEAGHYRHFLTYFRRYRDDERPDRKLIFKTLWGRIKEIDGEDAYIAFKHVWQALNPDKEFQRAHYVGVSRQIRQVAVDNYPFRMATHMALQPLDLSPRMQVRVDRLAAPAIRTLMKVGASSFFARNSQ